MALRKHELAASTETVALLAEKGVHKAHEKMMEAVDMVGTNNMTRTFPGGASWLSLLNHLCSFIPSIVWIN